MTVLNEKQTKRLLEMQKAMDSGAVQPDELIKIVEIILSSIKDIKDQLEKDMLDGDTKVATHNFDLIESLKKTIKRIEDSDKSSDIIKTIGQVKSDLIQEIKRVESTVPQDSSSDIGYLEDLIKTVESKIPQIKNIEGKEIVSKINALDIEPELQIGIEHISGLKEKIELLEKQNTKSGVNAIINGGVMGRELFQDIDISSQLDGVTTTFNIQAVYRIISVDLSSFPYGALRKNIDYSYTPTTITFLSPIVASSQLSSGQTCIITAVSA